MTQLSGGSTEQAKSDEPGARARLVQVLLILSFTTGLVDAITVLGLGKVFTANMTGNVVFLGFALAGVPDFHVAPYLIALGSFLMGAAGGGRFGLGRDTQQRSQWLKQSAMIEALLLWIAAAFAWDFDVSAQQPRWAAITIIALTGLAMGFRNATIRQLKVPDLTTTVLTMTITGLAADSTLAGGSNSNWKVRLLAVAAILFGAFAGAYLVAWTVLSIPLLLAGGLGLIGTAACAHVPRRLNEGSERHARQA